MSTAVEKDPRFVQLHEFNQPTLAAGDYQIEVTQVVKVAGHSGTISPFPASSLFTVAGERFQLKPTDVAAVFPPDGNLGDHWNCLPHIVFNRSTLPWERTVIGDSAESASIPWLALLIFDDDEKPEPKNLTAADLLAPRRPGAPKFPQIALESWQQQDDALTVIDVPYPVLSRIMPTAKELKLLTHVRFETAEERQGKNKEEAAEDKATPQELAIILANRLPQPGKTSTAHLVSLEKRFKKVEPEPHKFDYEFNYQNATHHSLIRLVSLKSWSFACESPKKSFTQLLIGLNNKPATLKLPDDPATAKKFFSEGYVAVPQYFRSGDQNLAWFRGPLIPGKNESPKIGLPAQSADALVRYDTEFAMFDISYAAAWELGRLLALQDKDFSTGLYQWKRQQAQRVAQVQQRLLHSHLSYPPATEFFVPEEISTWFKKLRRLEGVPFNYLVPDERMLPPESIRFFRVDSAWVDCLADGAFSIGRVASSDYEADQAHGTRALSAGFVPMITGFLLRSEVVSGWPGLVVDAFSDKAGSDDRRLIEWRVERLAPGVLLCLFAGAQELARVDIYETPEMLHFGFIKEPLRGFHKKLRDAKGVLLEKTIVDMNHWRLAEQRTVDVVAFGKAMVDKLEPSPPLTSAEFGLQMIESGDKIIFK